MIGCGDVQEDKVLLALPRELSASLPCPLTAQPEIGKPRRKSRNRCGIIQ